MVINPNSPRGRVRDHHPLWENHDFSGTETLFDLRPVRNLEQYIYPGLVVTLQQNLLTPFSF